MHNELNALVKLMKALSDPGRVTMLKLLETRPLCVCELQQCLKLAQPTISKHLRVLEEAQLVVRNRDGQWVEYSLNNAPDTPHATFMLNALHDWLKQDDKLTALKTELKDIDRRNICARTEEQ
ncbi:MAG: metalloregulator ArsR/SmtB family transcription factor [Desulfovibrionaceae bacterium]